MRVMITGVRVRLVIIITRLVARIMRAGARGSAYVRVYIYILYIYMRIIYKGSESLLKICQAPEIFACIRFLAVNPLIIPPQPLPLIVARFWAIVAHFKSGANSPRVNPAVIIYVCCNA